MRALRASLEERFWNFVNKTDGCWLWTGTLNGAGYGTIGLGRKDAGKGFAHRVSWEIHRGQIPKGLLVCHTCDCKICVNPAHLFLGTYQDNVDDMIRKNRSPRGDTWLTPARVEFQPKGDTHGMAKLTEAQVLTILRRFFIQRETKTKIAFDFGVSRAAIRNIVNGKNWKHIDIKAALAESQ